MNIVVLGHPRHPYTLRVLKALREHRIPLAALVASRKVPYHPEMVASVLRASGLTLRDLVTWDNVRIGIRSPRLALSVALRLVVPSIRDPASLRPVEHHRGYASEVETSLLAGLRVIWVEDYNGHRAHNIMLGLHPDLLVLAPGGTILRRTALQIPRIGTVNVHQGLLPTCRGLDTIEWSVFNGVPLAVSAYFVDTGIDTGDIIERRSLQVEPSMTLADVQREALRCSAQLMAEVVSSIMAGRYERHAQLPHEGKQLYRMHPTLQVEAKRRLVRYVGEKL